VLTNKPEKWKLKMDFYNSRKLEFLSNFDENRIIRKAVGYSFLMDLFSSKFDKEL